MSTSSAAAPPDAWPEQPLVSIIVNNYNYERFLAQALDSALGQSWPRVEVVVVDDGSTDRSREVISRYGGRVIAVLKENGGQATAYNAGWEAAHGDIAIFLDSDDMLRPETAAKVAEAFRASPRAAKVQYRLACVDEACRPLGRSWPRRGESMPNGDLTGVSRRFRAYVWPPGSGNAYPAWILRALLPVKEAAFFRVCADMYLSQLAPLRGPIVSLDEEGALYRLHGSNLWVGATRAPDLKMLREMFLRTEAICEQHVRLERGGRSTFDLWPLTLLLWRALSLKMDPRGHPLHEALGALCLRGARSVVLHPEAGFLRRVRALVWFLVLPLLPRELCWSIARGWRPVLFSRPELG